MTWQVAVKINMRIFVSGDFTENTSGKVRVEALGVEGFSAYGARCDWLFEARNLCGPLPPAFSEPSAVGAVYLDEVRHEKVDTMRCVGERHRLFFAEPAMKHSAEMLEDVLSPLRCIFEAPPVVITSLHRTLQQRHIDGQRRWMMSTGILRTVTLYYSAHVFVEGARIVKGCPDGGSRRPS
jgi:hypothetical protein